MTKKTSIATDDALLAAVGQFARQALAEGCNPAELSCALTAVAVRIGLDLAPSAGIAFAVVMRAVIDAAAEWASSQASPDTDVDSVATVSVDNGALTKFQFGIFDQLGQVAEIHRRRATAG